MDRSFYLKTKVLMGFGLVLMAIILASVIAYQSYEQLSRSVQTLSRQDTSIQQIDSIMVLVSKSENHLQEYTIEKSKEKLHTYDSLVRNVRLRVQRLNIVLPDNNRELDAILNLINAKLVSMNKFLEIREKRNDFRFYDEALEQLEEKVIQEKIQPPPNEQHQVDISKDTTQIPPDTQKEEKGWFRRIIDRLLKKQPTEEQSTSQTNPQIAETDEASEKDTLVAAEVSPPNLSVDSVRQMLIKLKSEQAATELYLDQQELNYLANNALVMNRIHELTAQVKHQRQTEYTKQSEKARKTLKSSLSRLGIILVIALVSTILFVYLIFTDITKSDFLKRQLELAKEKAEQLARVKEDFLANMSHEIRTPLTAILGFGGLLKTTKLTDQQQEYLAAVNSSSSHLLSLVNDILDYSKIEAGHLHFESVAFDLQQLVEQVCMDMRLQAEKKGLQLIYETDVEELNYVRGDVFRLRQVLYNLISNAIKFTKEGGLIVRTQLNALSPDYVSAQLQVIDSGIGIPEEKQQHIFDAFVQSDVSDTRKFGGTGLGLSISKKIIETQGGEIALESAPGVGTTFYIALPFRKSTKEEVLATETSEEDQISFGKMHVLVIDDDPLNKQLLSLMMEKWGVDCKLVSSGQEGLHVLRKQEINMVLVDLQMPEMPGEQVASSIREMGLDLPIIAFTARVTEKKDFFQNRGFDAVLHKPFRDEDVLQILREYGNAFATYREQSKEENNTKATVTDPSGDGAFFTFTNIQRFISDDQDTLLIFLENFTHVLGDAVTQLEKAIQEKDTQTMGYYAHKLYPNIAQLGVQDLLQLLRQIENDAVGDTEPEFLKDDVARVIVLCQKLEKLLLAHLNELKAKAN